jgi:murein DD-endopeptidase MepM/ murein hydrolase activator NlpD
MARVKGKFHIMVIPPSTDGVRQYSIPQWVVPSVLGAFALMVILTFTSASIAFHNSSHSSALDAKIQENQALRTQLAQLDNGVESLRGQVAALSDAEQRVRTVFGFPEIDPEERALGIGGSVLLTEESELSGFDLATFSTETEIDRLMRRCEFERENFDAMHAALVERKDQLNHTPSISPIPSHLVRGFGMKPDPWTGKTRLHAGIDLSAPVGTPVRASADGRVFATGSQARLGRQVTLDHGYNLKTRYGHLSKIVVKKGQQVKRGDIIAYSGRTGTVTGPHLHYEVHVNGRKINPMKYIYEIEPWEDDTQTVAVSDDF